MVVALDLEDHRESVSDVHQSGILFPGPDEQPPSAPGQRLHHRDGILVAAVLAPHDAVDPEFRIGRHAPQDPENPLVLFLRHSVMLRKRKIDFRLVGKIYREIHVSLPGVRDIESDDGSRQEIRPIERRAAVCENT